YSKSGFTRVVDRMEEAGLVRRARPENDRRTILIVLTRDGTETLERARRHHRDGIQRHFAVHLTDADVKALTRALGKVSTHARQLRPGRVRGQEDAHSSAPRSVGSPCVGSTMSTARSSNGRRRRTTSSAGTPG